MIQQTSLLAYAEQLRTGYISSHIDQLLTSLARFGRSGATDREVRDFCLPGWELGKVSARRNDCIKLGKIEQNGTKMCKKTNKTVNVWRVKV
jgi:hypothetical protein